MLIREKTRPKKPVSLPCIRPLVAGIDIGSTEHWVCGPARTDGKPNVQRFYTTTDQLNKLAGWLQEQKVESVAMESTSVYWIPIYELLESRGFEVLLVNARQLHNVPGRKTDVRDCQWLQLLHSCGLLRGSFRPDDAIVCLRSIHRQMENLVHERTRCVQWIQKSLDQMNVQVHRAVTDITGKTGMAIVRAIVDGHRSPAELAALRDARCRKSEEEFVEHLTGNWREEHLFNLGLSLQLYDTVNTMIIAYEQRLHEEMRKLRDPELEDTALPPHPNATKEKGFKRKGEQTARTELYQLAGVDLTRIDGIGVETARVILTELGDDLSKFPSHKHFVSWLRLCPRTPISGGKQLKKKKNTLGANRVSGVLRMAAVSLSKSKSALGAYYRRTARRKDGATAVFATARRLAILVYRMLQYGQDYVDIGEAAYEAQFLNRRLAGVEKSANDMGYKLIKAPELATTG